MAAYNYNTNMKLYNKQKYLNLNVRRVVQTMQLTQSQLTTSIIDIM